MLICPSFFDGHFDGIGRVSSAFYESIVCLTGRQPFVLSSNENRMTCAPEVGRCYERVYGRMLIDAIVGRFEQSCLKTTPIVCTHLSLSPVARILGWRLRRPYRLFIHGIECWQALVKRSRWGLTGAAVILANSKYTQQTFLECNPWAASIPSRVVPLGVTACIATTGPRSLPSLGFRVIAVGRLTKDAIYDRYRASDDLYKGFKQLILAIGIVAKEYPLSRLTIVGDGDARPELEQWLATRPERALVDILGRLPDERLSEEYRKSDVFALPSEGEGFGIVFVEAMAHHLPCVCVAAGAVPEVVEDGVTGLVAQPRNIVDLAAKLSRLAADRAFCEQLGANASRRFQERYSVEKFQGRVLDVLKATSV